MHLQKDQMDTITMDGGGEWGHLLGITTDPSSMGILEPWGGRIIPEGGASALLGAQQDGGRTGDSRKKSIIKTPGGKRSPRGSLWVANPRSGNKNVLQGDPTVRAMMGKG